MEANMRHRSIAALVPIVFMCLPLFGAPAPSSYYYTEGVDTTTADGHSEIGFTLGATSISGAAVMYGTRDYGYLNCTFDDVQKAPDSIVSPDSYLENVFVHCFLVHGSSDTWTKVQITRQLPDKRFVYRYGKNATSGSKMLLPQNYDRQRITRPNNVRWFEVYSRNGEIVQEITLVWEPPLPCNKTLLGYIVYGASSVDTSKPIDRKKWQQLATTRGTSVSFQIPATYFNVAAAYAGDTTDFPKPYVRLSFPICVIPRLSQQEGTGATPAPVNSSAPSAAAWYAVNGRLVSVRGFSGAPWAGPAGGWYFHRATKSGCAGIRPITATGQ
jgi:hypothetical protein